MTLIPRRSSEMIPWDTASRAPCGSEDCIPTTKYVEGESTEFHRVEK
jgi:hypothetical protein